MRPILLGVPTYKRYDLLAPMLDSVRAGTVQPARILVVDNGGRFDEEFKGNKTGIEVIRPGHNAGVAWAWNAVMALASAGTDVCLANDDLTLTPEGLATMQAKLASLDAPALVLGEGFSLFMLRRELFERVGPFDADFWPAYFEDSDYERRMDLLGLKRHDVPAAASHQKSATVKAYSTEEHAEFAALYSSNQGRYIAKWGGNPTFETYTVPFNGGPPV